MKGKGEDVRRSRSTLLVDVEESVLAEVLGRCSRLKYLKQEQVVRELDQDDNIYLVESGKLGVAQFSGSGREVGYRELVSGDSFGELSAIDGHPRSASVIALVNSEVTVMPFGVFRNLVESNNAFTVAVMRQLTGIIRKLSGRVYEFSTLSVSNRIHAELLRLARKNIDYDGVARIKSPPTHAQLASRVSCNREAVSRELKKLENLGLVGKVDRKWVIEDLNALQRLVDDVDSL